MLVGCGYAMLMRCNLLSMAASNQAHYIFVSLKGKARYQRGHSAQYSGFKFATSTFVLSVLLGLNVCSSTYVQN